MGLRWKLERFLSQDDPVITLVAGAGISIDAEEVDEQGVEVTITSTGSGGGGGGGGASGEQIATFAKFGTLSVGPGTGRFLMPLPGSVIGVEAAINTTPTGADIVIDVNKNGSTIFTTQANRQVIRNSQNQSPPPNGPDIPAFNAGDWFTVDIDQVGSSTPGADMVVQVIYELVPED